MTPAGARLSGNAVVIPLTFGNQSDWARNVRAAGGCSLRVNGCDYDATQPQFLNPEEAKQLVRSAFSPLERAASRCSASGSSSAYRSRLRSPGRAQADSTRRTRDRS